MIGLARVRVRHLAMATEFELVLYGHREEYLETVAEEVMGEIDRIERQLSFYREDSDVREINAHAAYHPVSLDWEVYRLLERARELSLVTKGAFDITVAPLLRCWGFVGASGKMPATEEIEGALERVGMHHLVLDGEAQTVAFDRKGVEIDLGAIGKGYAVDRVVAMLREFEIEAALFHGGTSTVYGLGAPPDQDGWQVAIQRPSVTGDELNAGRVRYIGEPVVAPNRVWEDSHLAVVKLRDEALNVSAPHGKSFRSDVDGRSYGHVIDPRTGYPTRVSLMAALVSPFATDGDALSTGLLTSGVGFIGELKRQIPEVRVLVAQKADVLDGEDAGRYLDVVSEGIAVHPAFRN